MNRIEEFYDEFSDYLIQDYIIVNPRHQKIRSFLKKEFFFHKHQSVLELGCGAGVLTGFFLKRKTRVTAVDISGKNISVARAIHGKGPFLQGDILKLDLGQSYDFIALFDVIEHIPEDRLKDLISVIESHTHESSRLALTFPYPLYTDYLKENKPELLQVVDETVSIGGIIRRLGEIGFTLEFFDLFGTRWTNQYSLMVLERSRHFSPRPYRYYGPLPVRILKKGGAMLKTYHIRLALMRLTGKIKKRMIKKKLQKEGISLQ